MSWWAEGEIVAWWLNNQAMNLPREFYSEKLYADRDYALEALWAMEQGL